MRQLSKTIVEYSLRLQENEKVLIKAESMDTKPLVQLLINEIYRVGAVPMVRYSDQETNELLMSKTNIARVALLKDQNEFDVNHYDAFISIRYIENDFNGKDIDKQILSEVGEALKESNDIRINQRRWVLLNYPSVTAAYKAGMPTKDFCKYAWDVMTVDYQKMHDLIKPLKELMERTDKVRIVAPNTDITFSIKDIPAIPCCGEYNIPDGEIFTAPVKNSVNGVITYNTPCPYQGNIYTNVSLTFENGKIVKATCNEDSESLNHIFDIDEGARYVGEFAIGLNPQILNPMGDILFDEKIIGSIHFTPGRAYREAFNGNISSIHWDMVLIERKEYGGGALYFDDVLIRQDGKFVLPELEPLNYHLK